MKTKSFISSCFAVVFTAIYLLSVAGFDMHSCSHTGKVYVSFLSHSLSCQDIHPDHGDEECCSCGHHHHQHHDNGEKGCCSDKSFQLLFSGDDNHHDDSIEVPVTTLHAAAPAIVLSVVLPCVPSRHVHGHCPHEHVPDIIRLNCVMRA